MYARVESFKVIFSKVTFSRKVSDFELFEHICCFSLFILMFDNYSFGLKFFFFLSVVSIISSCGVPNTALTRVPIYGYSAIFGPPSFFRALPIYLTFAYFFQMSYQQQTTKKRKLWDMMAMTEAVAAVKEKKMGYLQEYKTYNVLKRTLIRYVKDPRSIDEVIWKKIERKSVLLPDLQAQLATYCIKIENRFYELRSCGIRRLSFELAMRNGLKHTFPPRKQPADKKWFRLFMKRHRELQ